MWLNAAKGQGYSFYCFWVMKRKPTVGGGGKITLGPPPTAPPTPRLVLRTSIDFFPAKRKTYNKTFDLKFPRNTNLNGLSHMNTEKVSVFGVSLVISPYSVRMRENAGKMRTLFTPNTDTFYAVETFMKRWLRKRASHKKYLDWNTSFIHPWQVPQPTFTCLKLITKTPKQCVKSAQNFQWRHQNVAINIALVSLLLTLNNFTHCSNGFILEFEQVNTDWGTFEVDENDFGKT